MFWKTKLTPPPAPSSSTKELTQTLKELKDGIEQITKITAKFERCLQDLETNESKEIVTPEEKPTEPTEPKIPIIKKQIIKPDENDSIIKQTIKEIPGEEEVSKSTPFDDETPESIDTKENAGVKNLKQMFERQNSGSKGSKPRESIGRKNSVSSEDMEKIQKVRKYFPNP